MSANMVYLLLEISAPLVVVVYGLYLQKKPPKFKSVFLGYCTLRAMSSEAAWYAAQRIFGKYVTVTFSALFALSFLTGIFALVRDFGETAAYTAWMILCAADVIAAIADTIAAEKTLRRLFDKNGEPL